MIYWHPPPSSRRDRGLCPMLPCCQDFWASRSSSWIPSSPCPPSTRGSHREGRCPCRLHVLGQTTPLRSNLGYFSHPGTPHTLRRMSGVAGLGTLTKRCSLRIQLTLHGATHVMGWGNHQSLTGLLVPSDHSRAWFPEMCSCEVYA